MRLALDDAAATEVLGAGLASILRTGDVVGLVGELGAGKSTVARACIRTLAGAPIEVPSPTFTLVQAYVLPQLEVWHADLYRLTGSNDVDELGLEEASAHAALLIEWPERLPQDLFPDRLTVQLDWQEAGRSATLLGGAAWQDRLLPLSLAGKA